MNVINLKILAVAFASAIILNSCIPLPGPTGPNSICKSTKTAVQCPYNSTTLVANGILRTVHYQVPAGDAPNNGWPAVILFQGTGATASLFWTATQATDLFGAFNQTKLVKKLLDNGYAVITPETHLSGFTFWDTNNPLFADYNSSNDHAFMLKIFNGIDNGTFGEINSNKLFAGGISSGGYMTSRMALAYPGKFKALAIAAGSYATCAGPLCVLGHVPNDHPPTLFLHGSADPIVPLFTMELYFDKLKEKGIPVRKVVENLSLHRWIDASPNAVLSWFNTYKN